MYLTPPDINIYNIIAESWDIFQIKYFKLFSIYVIITTEKI